MDGFAGGASGIERVAQCHAFEQRAQAKPGILERLVGVREIVDAPNFFTPRL